MSRNHYVYIVCSGEFGEGRHGPVTAWASLDLAFADAEERCGVWPTHIGGVQWKATANAADEVYVYRLTVKAGASWAAAWTDLIEDRRAAAESAS